MTLEHVDHGRLLGCFDVNHLCSVGGVLMFTKTSVRCAASVLGAGSGTVYSSAERLGRQNRFHGLSVVCWWKAAAVFLHDVSCLQFFINRSWVYFCRVYFQVMETGFGFRCLVPLVCSAATSGLLWVNLCVLHHEEP